MTDVSNLKDNDILPETQKKVAQNLINMIQDLFNQEIKDNPTCTIFQYKNFIPMFTVMGTLAAAQLGINQDEYYMIVDYYIKELGLLAGDYNDDKEVEKRDQDSNK